MESFLPVMGTRYLLEVRCGVVLAEGSSRAVFYPYIRV